jgi:hypothetical protein
LESFAFFLILFDRFDQYDLFDSELLTDNCELPTDFCISFKLCWHYFRSKGIKFKAMKKFLPAFLFISLLSISKQSTAQDYKTALGIRLSTDAAVINNSVSIKHFLNEKLAIEGFLSFRDPVAIGGLLEVHKPLPSTEGLKWFYGAGVYLGFDSDRAKASRNLMGAMGTVGLDYKFVNVPLNLSLDWKPELNIVDDINFEPAAVGFTARFTFGKRAQAQPVSE